MRWGEKRYRSMDYDLKQAYGEKVYKITLDGGMTCPNRDGTLGHGGCIFCSADVYKRQVQCRMDGIWNRFPREYSCLLSLSQMCCRSCKLLSPDGTLDGFLLS